MSNVIAGLYNLIPFLPKSLPEKTRETNQVSASLPLSPIPSSSESSEASKSAGAEAEQRKIPSASKIVATFQLGNGKIIYITEDLIDQEIAKIPNLPPNLPRLTYLKLRHDIVINYAMFAEENWGIRGLPVFQDPTLKHLYFINAVLSEDYKPDAFREMQKRILSLNKQDPDKPYLILIFVETMLGHQKISIEEAEKLVNLAVREFPRNAEIKLEAYKFYLSIKKIYTAGSYLEEAIALNPAYQLDLGKYYILKSEVEKLSKNYGSALENLEAAEKIFKGEAEKNRNFSLPIFLADLSQKRAEIHILQGRHRAAYKALEFSGGKYEEAVKADPAVPELYLPLAKTYLMLLNAAPMCLRDKTPSFRHPVLEGERERFQQKRIQWAMDRYKLKLRDALGKAKKISLGDPQILLEIANAYAAWGKTDEAIKILREVRREDPMNPFPLIRLGDFLQAKGEVKASFKYYEEALKIVQKLDSLSGIYLHLFFLEKNADLELNILEAKNSNIAQHLYNGLSWGLLSYLSPVSAVFSLVDKTVAKGRNNNYKEDLQEIIRRARSLKSIALNKIHNMAGKTKNSIIFYLIAERMLVKANTILMQMRLKEKTEFVTEKEIEAYKDAAKILRKDATEMLKLILNKSLIKILKAEFQKAKQDKDAQKMLQIAQIYFGNYYFLAEISKNGILNKKHKKLLFEKREIAFKKGMEILKETLTLAKEAKNAEFSFEVYKLADKLYKKSLALEKNELKSKREFKKAAAVSLGMNVKETEIAEFLSEINNLSDELHEEYLTCSKEEQKELKEVPLDSLKATLDIVKDRKDFHSLKEFSKGIYTYGRFSIKAMEEAVALAGNDRTKLHEMGELIYGLWRKPEGKDLIKNLEIKETLRGLALSIYKKILAGAEGEEKILAYRRLWIFGDFNAAYQGCLSLINYYKNDRKMLGALYYELGLMALVRGKIKTARAWLANASNAYPDTLREGLRRLGLKNLKAGKIPDSHKINGNFSLADQQISAAMLLYRSWAETEAASKIFEEAVIDLYSAHRKKAEIKVISSKNGIEVDIQELVIHEIKIVGNSNTKAERILLGLKPAGLKPGINLSADPSEIKEQITEAMKQVAVVASEMRTFTVKGVTLEKKKEGKNVLMVEVEEQFEVGINVGGGGGSSNAMIFASLSHNNLKGEGKKIAIDYGREWYCPEGSARFDTWKGKFYYFDPYAFMIGEDAPVSAGFNVEKASRFDYDHKALEEMTGGGPIFRVPLGQGISLEIFPKFYYIQSETNYNELSLGTALEKDGRDNWLFPRSGYYLRTLLEPGIRQRDSARFFINNTNEARYYISLPWGMTLALRGVVGIGHNLFGGNRYFLGGNMLNPYVRGSGGSTLSGSGILAGSMELRARIIDLGFTKLQFYIFGDVGTLPGNDLPLLASAGAGVRFLFPYLGLPINLGYGYPGGFFSWLGTIGWI